MGLNLKKGFRRFPPPDKAPLPGPESGPLAHIPGPLQKKRVTDINLYRQGAESASTAILRAFSQSNEELFPVADGNATRDQNATEQMHERF